ncbi:MAG: hypothetical protein KDD33_04790, partial [Bdellovibrionales bacterium]|nr:hypothetical protein [Bdellovibrionales bacterium]
SALIFSLFGCVKADRKQTSGEDVKTFSTEKRLTEFNTRSLFEAGGIQLDYKKFNRIQEGEWKQVDSFQLYFKVCNLKDRATQGTLVGEKFHVSSELGQNVFDTEKGRTQVSNPITVNSQQCLVWHQPIPVFNLLAPSVNIVLHYKIESLAGNLGTLVRRVGINPWDIFRSGSQSSGIIDLTDLDRQDWPEGQWVTGEENIIKALKGELFENKARLAVRSIVVEPVEREKERNEDYNKSLQSMDPEERKRRQEIDKMLLTRYKGVHLNINMTALPFVRLEDSTGVVDDQPITTGRFRIYMNLIARASGDGKTTNLSQNTAQIAGRNSAAFVYKMTTNGLQASVPIFLERNSTFGRVELLVKIVPLDLPGVQPFSAVYDLGEHNQWAKRQSPQFTFEKYDPLSDVDYEKYIERAGGDGDGSATIRNAERFYFGPLKMRFIRIMPGETATDRTLQYSVTTCVAHGLYGTRVGPGLQFDIITEDKGREHFMRRQTNEDGCLTWFGFLSHKYYHKEVLEEKTAKVNFVGTKVDRTQWQDLVNKYSKEFVYYMNPWDEKWTFGWDRPDMPNNYFQEIIAQKNTAPESKLFIADFRYETMGFRYAIDKYLNLKVKKAVLLKAYPYVLKYNSIVLGRNATEKLRDGVYLMKIALQKHYLDPAAKGVRIYDRKNDEPLNLDNNKVSHPPYPVAEQNGQEVVIDSEPLSKEDLDEGKKEYISIQQKLVRVMGGMIITPIEFEVDDLRLMRIRNQFFIQLQTIDEHKLRLASVIDKALDELYADGNIEGRYKEIFAALDEIQDIEDQKLQLEADKRQGEVERAEVAKEINKLGLSLKEAQEKVYKMFGLDRFDSSSKEFATMQQAIDNKIKRLQEYRRLGLDEQAAFRNDKRALTNRLIYQLGGDAKALMQKDWSQSVDEEYKDTFRDDPKDPVDPFQRFFYLGNAGYGESALQRIIDYRIEKAQQSNDKQQVEDLQEIRSADFTESPLTPNFSFEMLRNDGLGEDQSGLPSRTFVGPLTFVYNTNGSSLRPTDILNEKYCTTAFCEVPRMIEQGVPPEKTEKSFRLDDKASFAEPSNEPIYDSGDSVNANYENNKYYGYLKAYHEMTVDKLIEEKKKLEERALRKMEEGSQIINFVKTLGLKYALLDESDRRSHLKSIDHECAQSVEPRNIGRCFQDIQDSNLTISSGQLFTMLNHRAGGQLDMEDANSGQGNSVHYNTIGGEVTKQDIFSVMEKGWKNEDLDPQVSRKLMHRMCFVLAQQFFKKGYFAKPIDPSERLTKALTQEIMNRRSVGGLESLCHEVAHKLYGHDTGRMSPNKNARPLENWYPPVIFERKVRVYKTTKRYVYRGGKSLNINVNTSFNLSSSHGIKVSTSATFKPWEWVKDTFKDVVNSVPVVGPIVTNIAGAFGVTRTDSMDESAGRTNGTTINSGTFLVSQQATFNIAIGEYERCIVARLHPAIIKAFLESGSYLKNRFNAKTDIDTQGILICSGQRETKCLPIKEKYYYFTQHFTEGDMLDTADLHNHPWLLQLRGFRDFQTFAHQIGAREVDYIDNKNWLTSLANRVTSDAASFNMGAGHEDMMKPQFEIVDKSKDINWPLEELSRTYFEILPTFPGLYTYLDETGKDEKEWPHENTNPGRDNLCPE